MISLRIGFATVARAVPVKVGNTKREIELHICAACADQERRQKAGK